MEQTATKEKFTLVLFSGDLDRALSAFILATTAASMGMEVTMFFTFWGLNAIRKKEGGTRSRGIMRKMLNVLNRGGSNRLPLSKFNMMGAGTAMMKRLMKEAKMPSIEELIVTAQEMGVKMVPCSTTCGVMGLPEDAFRSGIMDPAGASFFLSEARESKITLFI